MYFDDHNPPHFHAVYGISEGQVTLDPIRLLRSNLPLRAASMAVEWAALHQQELIANWERLRADQVPMKVAPLE